MRNAPRPPPAALPSRRRAHLILYCYSRIVKCLPALHVCACSLPLELDQPLRRPDNSRVVTAKLVYDDWDASITSRGKFEVPYDASKTSLTRAEWDAAIADVNSVFEHKGAMGMLCCLCGEAVDHEHDLKKKCRQLTEKHAAKGVEFHCKVKEDEWGQVADFFMPLGGMM